MSWGYARWFNSAHTCLRKGKAHELGLCPLVHVQGEGETVSDYYACSPRFFIRPHSPGGWPPPPLAD